VKYARVARHEDPPRGERARMGASGSDTTTDEATSFSCPARATWRQGGHLHPTTPAIRVLGSRHQGGESAENDRRWRRSRGSATRSSNRTKLGDRPLGPRHRSPTKPKDCSGPRVIRGESAERRRDRLGMARLYLLYEPHRGSAVCRCRDRDASRAGGPEGHRGLWGVSNQWAWRT